MESTDQNDLAFLSATDLTHRLRTRDVSPVELVQLFLERIQRIDPGIGSFVTLNAELAMRAARAAEQAFASAGVDRLGALYGLPIAVKDLTPTAGVRTTFGCAAFEHHVPEADSPDVARLFEAGAILIGKTNTPELGHSMTTEEGLFPPTRNPWDVTRSAGGSSGGSAAALAAHLCPMATGSDAGGSARIPAAACGVVGLKPSRGRVIPMSLDYAAMAGFATPGPMGRTVADVALQLEVLTLPFLRRTDAVPTQDVPLRVGWVSGSDLVSVEADVSALIERVAVLLAAMGHQVHQSTPDTSGVYDHFLTIVEAHTAMLPITDYTKLGVHARAVFERGKGHSATDYLRAEYALLAVRRRVMGWFRQFDVLLCPTLPTVAPPLGTLVGPEQDVRDKLEKFGAFTYWVNVTGNPAISLPLGVSSSGMPIGVQLVGRINSDDMLLRLASQLEEAMPWARRLPATALG